MKKFFFLKHCLLSMIIELQPTWNIYIATYMNTNMLKTFTMIMMFNEFQKEEFFLVYKNIKIKVFLNHVL